ncbi:laccase-11-like [Lathyrus oleraceus]|uniref:laccase-11-like n=1 Tax=Pisum sativum TaxID=3888 RepID=UPI0021D2F94A|nr:laccase-11-like [Pisum sativum]
MLKVVPTDCSECPICLEEFRVRNEVRGLPCAHNFHVECIDEWLRLNVKCPRCRCSVFPNLDLSALSNLRPDSERSSASVVTTTSYQGNKMGLPPNMSEAHTINGKPGPLFPCFEKHTFAMEVEQGKKYLMRIINVALNDELFFAIAGHNMTVVEVDVVYTKPFTTQAILIAPGQTTNVLVRANHVAGRYFMAAKAFMDAPVSVDNKTATAIFQYKDIPNIVLPVLPQLPASNDTGFALSYNKKLKSLNSAKFPAKAPLKVDRNLFYTIGLGKNSCPTCLNGTRFLASISNVSFVMPQIALLQAHYFDIKGVFRADFPDHPPTPFNYTGAPLTANLASLTGTRVNKISFNFTVELVLQNTNLLIVESHPGL